MAELEIRNETRKLSTGSEIIVIQVSGSIDASTYASYEDSLNRQQVKFYYQ